MRDALMAIVFAAAALLSAGHAAAQEVHDPEFPEEPLYGQPCQLYAAYWAQVADIARRRGCVPPGDEWTSDYSEQLKVCSTNYDTALVLIADRNAKMKTVTRGNCGACAVLVDQQSYYATGNLLYKCKFSSSVDARWDPARENEMNICFGQFNGNDIPRVRAAYVKMIAEMRVQMEQCKLTHKPQGCMFSGCHSSNSAHSSSAVQAMPKSGNALRDSLRQLPDRTRPKVVKVVDPCKTSARSFDPSCNRKSPTSATNSGANSGAMDRLQGGSPSAPSSGTREQRGSPSRPAATPAAAAAPSIKPDLTTDFGNCATCGKPPARPPR